LDFIGGKDSPDDNCLFRVFNGAKRALKEFKETDLKIPPWPWWYWIGHVLAALFFLGALLMFGVWVWL
jgi:hypothetical protein